jgi:hypothetical protein
VDEKIISECFTDIEKKDVHWIHLAQDRDPWWALANTVIIFGFE